MSFAAIKELIASQLLHSQVLAAIVQVILIPATATVLPTQIVICLTEAQLLLHNSVTSSDSLHTSMTANVMQCVFLPTPTPSRPVSTPPAAVTAIPVAPSSGGLYSYSVPSGVHLTRVLPLIHYSQAFITIARRRHQYMTGISTLDTITYRLQGIHIMPLHSIVM
jgi:hypothetical protein